MKLLNTNVSIIYIFIIINIAAFCILGLIPAKALISNSIFIFLLNLSFLSLVIVFALLTYFIIPKKRMKVNRNLMNSNIIRKNFLLLSILPIIGIILVSYDRIITRGINYSEGLRYARYAWLDTSGGNVLGILGNLLIPFSYVGIFFIILYSTSVSKKLQVFLIISIFFGVIGHAALNGGRSNLLLAIIMIIISMIFKKKQRNKTLYKDYLTKTKIFLLGIIATTYIWYITSLSASMGGTGIGELLQEGIVALYGIPNQAFFSNEHSSLIYFLIYFLSYLFHGQWTAEISYSLIDRGGNYSIPPIIGILANKFNLGKITEGQTYFGDTGAFISLPGGFYYDYGFFGLILLSIFLGNLLGVAFVLINKSKRIGGLQTVFIMSILYILFMSPIIAAYGLSYFSFIMYAFLMLSIINILVFKHKINLLP